MSRMRVQNALEPTNDWQVNNNPGANAQATITKAAPGPDKRLICTGITVVVTSTTAAPAAKVVRAVLRDGASGSGAVLWGPFPLAVQATAGVPSGIARSALYIEGSPNTAMTLEFDAAGGANTEEAVGMEGTTVQA